MSDWRATDAADAPVEALGPRRQVRITGAVFVDATGLLADLQREADEWSNLHPGGEA